MLVDEGQHGGRGSFPCVTGSSIGKCIIQVVSLSQNARPENVQGIMRKFTGDDWTKHEKEKER
jgi:hypothetical protein